VILFLIGKVHHWVFASHHKPLDHSLQSTAFNLLHFLWFSSNLSWNFEAPNIFLEKMLNFCFFWNLICARLLKTQVFCEIVTDNFGVASKKEKKSHFIKHHSYHGQTKPLYLPNPTQPGFFRKQPRAMSLIRVFASTSWIQCCYHKQVHQK